MTGKDLLARDINDYRESSAIACFGHELGGDELGNGLREIDTVDKDVDVDDLLEGSSLLGLGHIPLDDVVPMQSAHIRPSQEGKSLLLETSLPEEVHSSTSTSTQSTNDQNLDILHAPLNTLQSLLDVIDHLGLVDIWLQTLQNALSTLFLLLGKSKSTSCGTCKPGVETECSDSSLGAWVF
jgi:hypothetical protein